MKIGMSLTSSYPLTQDSRTIMENLVEEVKLMAQLGFDSFSLGDHHLTHNHYVQVLPAISSLSAISGDMQLLPLFLLPFYNPILLAEQLATLDVISGGRTTVINALGYDAAAFTAFQTTQRARVSRFTETFEIMRMLWERDGVRMHLCWGNYEGPHHRDIPMEEIVGTVLKARPQAFFFEVANPRHEHEWEAFKNVKLPDGKIIIPGVLDSTTNYIELPKLIAQRIVRYAALVGKENVIAGSDCGFGTFARTNYQVEPGIVWAKFKTMSEGARLASEQLWG